MFDKLRYAGANRATTLAGIGTIMGAIGSALVAHFDGDPSTIVDWPLVWAGLVSGWGLIVARNAWPMRQPSDVDRQL